MKCPNYEKCATELTENFKGTGCKRCLTCNPETAYVPPKDRESKYVDIKMTDEKVQELVEESIDKIVPDMIREVLENWHIQRPPVTAEEIAEATGGEEVVTKLQKPETWRQEAKRLGVSVYDTERKCPRKKVDVLKDIKEKTCATV